MRLNLFQFDVVVVVVGQFVRRGVENLARAKYLFELHFKKISKVFCCFILVRLRFQLI